MKNLIVVTLVFMAVFSVLCFESSFAGVLIYSTYLGGGDEDYGYGIAIDSLGNTYVTGWTASTDFPTTLGAFDTLSNGADDVFVTKINASGTALVYSTYLGGGSGDEGHGISIDDLGNAYITGWTWSADFPTTPGAFDTSYNGYEDGFVTKLNPNGTGLVYSTYLGSENSDEGYGITIDNSGNAYITGWTASTNFPTTSGAFDTSFNGGTYDVFVTKLNASGTALVYSTYLGGGDTDEGYGIAIDSTSNIYITGNTWSTDFPTTSGAFDTSFNGGDTDVFVTKLNASGTALVYSTYLGGEGIDYGWGIAIDSLKNAYIIGETGSSDFPTTPGAFDVSFNGGEDVFVTNLNASGTALVYSTYLGGGDNDFGYGIALNSSGNAYIIGYTSSSDFPTTPGAFDTTSNGYTDVFVTNLNASGTALVYSTYLGDENEDYGYAITVDSSGNVYTTGYTGSSNFPTTPGAIDTSFNGGYSDIFVTKMSLLPLAVSNIPDIKLLTGKPQSHVLKLNDYLVNTPLADWTWSSHSTFANLTIDNNSWVDYLTPWLPYAGQDTVVFTANNFAHDTSLLKYSTYLLKRLPDAVVDNGRKLLNCEINLTNYISKDTSIGYPNVYPYEIRYSNPSDSGKLNVTFSKNTIKLNPTSALLGSAEVIVTATPENSVSEVNPQSEIYNLQSTDWDKELIHVSEVLDTYGEFSIVNDTWHYWFTLPVVGATSLPGISWVNNFAGRSGVLALNFSTASQGVKVVYNQEIDIQPFTWYTLRCAFASNAGAGNKHQVSGQLFGVDTVTGVSETGEFLRQPGLLRDSQWWTQYAYLYSSSSTMVKLRPMLVVKNNGSPETVYVDSLLVYASKPMTERAYGVLAKSALSNGSFANGLSGWFYGLPAQGVAPGTPLPDYAVAPSVFGQDNALVVGFTQASQGLKMTSDPVVSIIPMKTLRLSWKAYSQENNPARLVTGRIYCIDEAPGGSLSDAIGPSGLSSGSMPVGKWVTYTAVGTPLLNTETQARVQLVIKNGMKANDSLYLDDIALEQENDSPYYWDHTLF